MPMTSLRDDAAENDPVHFLIVTPYTMSSEPALVLCAALFLTFFQ